MGLTDAASRLDGGDCGGAPLGAFLGAPRWPPGVRPLEEPRQQPLDVRKTGGPRRAALDKMLQKQLVDSILTACLNRPSPSSETA